MPVVRVEPDERVKQDRCDRCGGKTWMILGYLYADEEPHGLYYVDWCEGGHEERVAYITVSLGDYVSEDATGADRDAFCIETRCEAMTLAATPVRDRPDFLGRFVTLEAAREREDLGHLWHVCDHLTEDRHVAAVAAWLCGHLDTALDADDDAPARC